ncbi:MAG: hypothetical protein KG003_14690 [Bacteroidetes bacterium]|nr:hypothetical protein [Bacteroidota bacterium]
MNNDNLKDHIYIRELLQMESNYPDRNEFHEHVKPLLLKMGADKEFLKLVVKRNLDDQGYLNQEWSAYNIPYFLIYETDDFVLKIHLFPPAEKYVPGIAAHAIHHHNNYILTTNAFFGSGYESILFDKKVETDPATLRTKLTVRKQFHQKDWNPSRVEAWEPHIVFLPETLSATLLIWTPERKRATDALRNKGLLKAIKKPLRKAIQVFGLEGAFGIAKGKTFQYYAAPDGNGFMAVEEDVYFAPSRANKGAEMNDKSMQLLFAFIQQADIADLVYMQQRLLKPGLPEYYKKWIQKILNQETIEPVFHQTEINIPQKTYTMEDILHAANSKNSR